MSQDQENNPGDSDFDANAGTPFSDDSFDPFAEDGFSFTDEMPQSEVAEASEVSAETPMESPFDLPGPSSFLTGESTTEELAEPPAVEEEETDAKGKKKKKKEKAKKEKKPKAEKKKKEKKSKEPGEKTSMGLGGVMCLLFGFLLLLGLVACNALLFMTDPKELGVGASSIMYYLVGVDVVGLIGIVSVPFLFFLYRKDIDIFKVGLGVSAMAMSLGVILLMTALFRYDFVIKAPTSAPSTDIPVSAAPAAPVAE